MGLASYHVRKGYTVFRNEILVLPSRVILSLFVIGLLTLPLFTHDPYLLRILILTSIFAILAASWDLLSGYTGQINFGHALFFGVGAYSAAMLNLHAHIPPWGSIPLGAVAAVLTGLIIGIPCLRLKGTYLALTTLAFPIILMGIIFALPGFTGGELGVSGLQRLSNSRVHDYYITSILMLVLCTVMWKITDSNTGIIFHAIREDELAVRTAGINTTRYKLLAFSLSGFFAGISGGLYAHFMRIAGPSTLEVSMSFTVVIWAIFGGVVTIYGPVGAVFVLFPLLEFFRFWPEYRTLLFAAVILLILLYMPEGLLPWVRDKIETECPRCKIRNVATRKTCRICTAPLD
ncbi:MAG: branched-chain amino acid ABC transporter permease [Deltaproteobacteria bacterium HGW-Deltaproteobacteria-15]|jgi:branched-chain amino acid transport system permease protein|nr:MAG: branched-chain amino acid ABC transporter permease [Deltaproteobacteria bacterium HGW-Deltaproteobacteria-15]